MSSSTGGSDDDFLTWVVGIFGVILLGPGLLAKFVPAAQQVLIDTHVLAVDNVLIPLGPGAGFDLPRVLIIGGIVALLILLLVVGIRRRTARVSAERGRS